jgi:hypothetical protein
MSNPRYRKSPPPWNSPFQTPEDREKALKEAREYQDFIFSAIRSKIPDMKTTNRLTKTQQKIIRALVAKCTKFCPHIDSLIMPKVNHCIFPEIGTVSCYVCADDFLKLIAQESDNNCNYCGLENDNFVAFSVPLGTGGLVSFNLGTKCCAGKLTGEKYPESE